MISNAPYEHICLINEDPEQPLQWLGSVVADRLADGYRCVCVIADQRQSACRQSLAETGIDLAEAYADNRLVCLPCSTLRSGNMDPSRAIRELLSRESEIARASGFGGILLWLDMSQISPESVSTDVIDDALNSTGRPEHVTIVCAFDRSVAAPEQILDALHQHPLVYVDHRLQPSPLFNTRTNPEEHDQPAAILDQVLRQLRRNESGDTPVSGLADTEAAILDAIPDPFFTIDREQRFIYVNKTARNLWPRWTDEFLGTSLAEVFPDTVGIYGYDQIQRAFEDGRPREFEVDSSYLGHWTEVRVLPYRGGLAITYRDISQRKATEEALANRLRQQAIVTELGQHALTGLRFDDLLQETVSAVRQTLGVDYVGVFEVTPAESGLQLVAGIGWDEDLTGNLLLDTGTASLAGYTLLIGDPVIFEDLAGESRFQVPEFLNVHGIRSGISVVIGGQQRPYGVLEAHTREKTTFSHDDVNFLQAIANILATAIDHARADQLLLHHAAIVTSSEDAIIGESLDGIITSWNDAAQRMFGYSEEEAVGQPITIIYPPDRTMNAYELLERIKQGDRIEQMETIRYRKSGEIFYASISVSPIRDPSGRVIGAAKIERDISAQKRAEAERRASEDRLQLALDAGKMGTWDWEIGSDVLEWSPNMIKMHGLQPDDFHGRFEDFSERIHPDDRERVLNQIQTAIADESPFHTEYRNLRPDGSLQWLEARGRVSRGSLGEPDHMNGVCIDVTEQVSLRQQIARFAAATVAERDRLQQVIDVIPEGIVIVTAEGKIGMSNEAARAIWGDQLSDIDLEAHALSEGPPEPGESRRFADLPVWRSLINGENIIGEQVTVTRYDRTEPVQLLLNGAPIRDERGHITSVVTTFQDITPIKDFERQKDAFLQMISHDLKNPLTSIKGNAQLLKRRARSDAADISPIIERIDGSTDQATALIDELLDIARLQMGRPLDLVRKPTPVNELVRRTVEGFRVTSDDHRFRIVAKQDVIVGSLDEHRVARVLSNLLSNAVKYSDPQSEIVITTEILDDDGGWFQLSVRDHGIGIPAADLPLLFERFRRGSNVVGQIRGSGLGLASSRQIVEQHGGTISVQSEEGRGSTFTVRLPLATLSDADEHSELN